MENFNPTEDSVIVSDSGVIQIVLRPLRDNQEDIPSNCPSYDRHLYLEAWRAGEVIALVRNEIDDKVLPKYEKNYWYSKCRMCMIHGLALGVFVGGKSSQTEYKFGAPVAAHLILPDTMNPKQALLIHTMVEAFGGTSAQVAALKWGTRWAADRGRILVRFEDRVKGIPVRIE